MINENYWRDYHDFWDKFVKEWYEQCPNEPSDEVSTAYKRCVKGLNFDELPEPYYGMPEKEVKAVIINLNPGMSQTDKRDECLERQKFYSLKDTYRGDGPFVKMSLVREFVDSCNAKYSEFAHKWSCLDSNYRRKDTDLCGVKWWQGNNPQRADGKRIPWMCRFYQTNIEPERVFALELCPYHSKGFSLNNRDNVARRTLGEFIVEKVIKPAATAIVENHLPFALAVGKGVADVLDNVGAEFVKEWSYKEPIDEWPQNSGGELTKRTYRRYIVEAHNGQKANIIVTWLKTNLGIPAPGKEFDCVERLIRNDCGLNNEDMVKETDIEKCDGKHAVIKKRDTTKYSFKGKIGLKQQEMVEVVIRQYLKDNPSSSFEELQDAFPQHLQGTYGCVCKVSDIVALDRFRPNHITLTDGTEIAICSQWGRAWGVGNIPQFLTRAKELGYEIEEIPPVNQ